MLCEFKLDILIHMFHNTIFFYNDSMLITQNTNLYSSCCLQMGVSAEVNTFINSILNYIKSVESALTQSEQNEYYPANNFCLTYRTVDHWLNQYQENIVCLQHKI